MFVKALVLLLGLCAVDALKCHVCQNGSDCSQTEDCQETLWALGFSQDRCYIVEEHDGKIQKGCAHHTTCSVFQSCCESDLCNAAPTSGPELLLPLLIISSIFTLFL